MSFLQKLFGPKTDFKQLMKNGAVIVDVRTSAEYNDGNIKGSRNISLDQLNSKIKELQLLRKPIIACCRSGVRSGMAVRALKAAGLEAYNGGPWTQLQGKL